MEVRHRHLRGRYQVQAVAGLVHVVCEVRKLSGAQRAAFVDQRRGPRFPITVLGGVYVQHEVYQAPDQLRTLPHVRRKPTSGDLGATREVQHSQVFSQLPMWLGFERKAWPVSPRPEFLIGGGVALRNVVEGDIRDLEHLLFEARLDLAQLLIFLFYLTT